MDATVSQIKTQPEGIENIPLTVLIVDDHPVVRLGLSILFDNEADLTLVGAATGCTDAREMVMTLRPQVVLLDLVLGDGSACPFINEITGNDEGPGIVAYTAHDQDSRVFEALRCGAAGYVLKGSQPVILCAAIRAVAWGGSYLDPAVAPRVLDRLGVSEAAGSANRGELTKRENAVLVEVAAGKRNKDIAQELFITERTVKYHLNSVYSKLRVKSRTEAVKIAAEHGLIAI